MTSPSGGGGVTGCDKQEAATLPLPVEELWSAQVKAAFSETQPGSKKVKDTSAGAQDNFKALLLLEISINLISVVNVLTLQYIFLCY